MNRNGATVTEPTPCLWSAQFAEWALTKLLLCSSTTHLTLQTSSKSHKVWHTRIQIFTLSIRKMNPMGQSAPPTENKNSCLPVPSYWRTIFKFLSCQNRVVNLQSSNFSVSQKTLCFKNSLLWVISWKHTLFILQLLKDEAANSSPLIFSAAKLCLSSHAGSDIVISECFLFTVGPVPAECIVKYYFFPLALCVFTSLLFPTV